MKINKILFILELFIASQMFSIFIKAQLNFTVNSLEDDEYSYAWDDPNTPEDESVDGICNDELGRCTLMAAVGEGSNMGSPVNIDFSVSGTINLLNTVYLDDGSTIDGGGKIELKNDIQCMQVGSQTEVMGLTFNDAFLGLGIDGEFNIIGYQDQGNTFINCLVGISIDGDLNELYSNYLGLDSNDVIQPNNFGIMVYGSLNMIGSDINLELENIICGSTYAGITLSLGGHNSIDGNLIGTNIWSSTGYGNNQGITIEGSSYNVITGNTIAGNQQFGIFIGGASPDDFSEWNIVSNNFFGIDIFGEIIPNGTGIVITNSTKSTEIDSNFISGNDQNGILIYAYDDISETRSHIITSNYIGLTPGLNAAPNNNGISIVGNVKSVLIGTNVNNIYKPNNIAGNLNAGIAVNSGYGFSPDSIILRKNIIKQNGVTNLIVDPLCNSGIQPPFGLSMNWNTLAGIHDLPNVLIDIYRASRFEGPTSAYEWLGSTMTETNGVFSFVINDPTVEAVSVTATTSSMGTSSFAYFQIVTNVKSENELPTEFLLEQNYPNPFNPSTMISWQAPVSNYTTLKVYDVLGNEVATLVNEYKQAGNYEVEFNAKGLSSGVYFYRMVSGLFTNTKKLLLTK